MGCPMKFTVVADCGEINAACLEFKDLASRARPIDKKLIQQLTPDEPAKLATVVRTYRRGSAIHVEVGPSDLLIRILEILHERVEPRVT